MNINKDNYEEYFLLFADNELSGQERDVVEAFVRAHPDLEEEFLMIKQSVFKPEHDLKLEDKSYLHKHTKKFVSYDNYQEVFILYADNELTGPEKDETNSFLSENPSLKNEFEVFRNTKLQADKTIVFPDKNLLFKREGVEKVVPFRWWKAIAAILVGLGIWTGIDFLKESKVRVPAAVKNDMVKRPGINNSIVTDTGSIKPVTVAGNGKPVNKLLKQKSLSGTGNKVFAKASAVKNGRLLKSQKLGNNLPAVNSMAKKIEDEQQAEVIAETIPANDQFARQNDETDNKEVRQAETLTATKDAIPDVLTASYSIGNEDDNDYAFYNITEAKFNKSKVGGFLRKVKRIVERKISPLNNSKNKREVAVN